MKILLAVDGSEYTKKMLAYLATHDELFAVNNQYTVLTVQPSLPPRVRGAVGKAVVEKYFSEEAEKVLAPVTKFLLRHGIDAKSSWKVGSVGETIAKLLKPENLTCWYWAPTAMARWSIWSWVRWQPRCWQIAACRC